MQYQGNALFEMIFNLLVFNLWSFFYASGVFLEVQIYIQAYMCGFKPQKSVSHRTEYSKWVIHGFSLPCLKELVSECDLILKRVWFFFL